MATPDESELRRMAQAIDADQHPRVQITGEMSAEGARRLRDVLIVASHEQLIEHIWPMLRMLDMLDEALA